MLPVKKLEKYRKTKPKKNKVKQKFLKSKKA